MTQSFIGMNEPSENILPKMTMLPKRPQTAKFARPTQTSLKNPVPFKISCLPAYNHEYRRPLPFSCHCTWKYTSGLMPQGRRRYGNYSLLQNHSFSKNALTRQLLYAKYCAVSVANHQYPDISSERILLGNRVQNAINDVTNADEDYDCNKDEQVNASKEKVLVFLRNIKASISSWLLKLTGWILLPVFSQIFDAVIINEGEMKMIEEASKRKAPLIFVPLHRSHVDYLLVTWVLFLRNLPAPIVAAGDNLQIPVFGSLLRGLGGFFIRRSRRSLKYNDSILYGATLNTYITQALASGYNMEFFIEGGRSRSGKHYSAKEGLMTVICNAFLHEDLHDALIVPVGINYDKLVEGNFIKEQLGESKVPETFVGALKAICSTLTTNHGFARINFGKPFSLKECHEYYIENVASPDEHWDDRENTRTYAETPSYCPNILVPEVTECDRKFVQSVSKHIVYNSSKCQAVMSTNILAWVMCNMCRGPTPIEKVISSFEMVKTEIMLKSMDVGFTGNSEDVVKRAIELLGPSLLYTSVESGLTMVTPILVSPNIIELTYYSNSVTSIFALQAVVATCIAAHVEPTLSFHKGEMFRKTISVDKLLFSCGELANLLSHEFILHSPCENVKDAIQDAIQTMIKSGFLSQKSGRGGRNGRYNPFGDDDEYVESVYNIHPTSSNMTMYHALVNCLSPYIHVAYYMFSCSLTLRDGQKEDKFVRTVQEYIKELLEKGTIHRAETVCIEPIKNFVKGFLYFGTFEYLTHEEETLLVLREDVDEARIYTLMKSVYFYMDNKPESFHVQ